MPPTGTTTTRGTNTHCFWSIWTVGATFNFATGGGTNNDTTLLRRPMSDDTTMSFRILGGPAGCVIHGDLKLFDLDGTARQSDGSFDSPGSSQAGAAPDGEPHASGYRFCSPAHSVSTCQPGEVAKVRRA